MTENKSSTDEPRHRNERMFPGGSLDDAKRAVGMNAVDRDMLPSRGMSPQQTDFADSPDEPPRHGPAAPK
jgi:hypothetical protein